MSEIQFVMRFCFMFANGNQTLPTTNLSSVLIIGWSQSVTQSNQSKVAKSENDAFLLVIIIGRVCRKGKVNIY